MMYDTNVLIAVTISEDRSGVDSVLLGSYSTEPVHYSTVQLAELADWACREGIDPIGVVTRIMSCGDEVPLTERICIEGAKVKKEMWDAGVKKFGIIDGIILASARSIGEPLLTLDSDFRKAEGAIVLKSG